MESPFEALRVLCANAPNGTVTMRTGVLLELVDELDRADELCETWSSRAVEAEQELSELLCGLAVLNPGRPGSDEFSD